MEATVDLITKLQPHFLSVWTFQGWNLAYNVSVEWDAPEDKYEWIKKGIKFLQDGVKKNQKSPDLIWDTAWTYYHKLGFADESIILRRLFRDDDDEDVQDVRRPGRATSRSSATTTSSSATAGSAGPSRLVDEGEQRLADRPPRRTSSTSTRPPAQGAARRPGLPLDARPRPDPLRRRPGEDEHGRHPRHLRRGRQERVAAGARTTGSSSASTSSPPTTTRDAARWSGIDDATNPEQLRKACTDNQQYWTNRWADQMNYRYWKDRCAGRDDRRGRRRPASSSTRGPWPTRPPTSRRPSRSSARASTSGTKLLKRPQGLPQRRLQQEGHRPGRQALPPGPAGSSASPSPKDVPVQGPAQGRRARRHPRPVRRHRDARRLDRPRPAGTRPRRRPGPRDRARSPPASNRSSRRGRAPRRPPPGAAAASSPATASRVQSRLATVDRRPPVRPTWPIDRHRPNRQAAPP